MDTRTKASLDTIRIPTPCPKTWGELSGDERRRYCGACQFHVTNLSALTRSEADEFLATRSGRTCVTYVQRSDGSIVTREPVRASRLPSWMRSAAAALFALLPFVTACTRATGEVASDGDSDADDVRTLGRPAAVLGEVQLLGVTAPNDAASTADASSQEAPADAMPSSTEPPK